MFTLAKLAARLSAQFVRERPFDHVDTIADDAVNAARLAIEIKARPGTTGPRNRLHRLKDLSDIAKKYSGNVVSPFDADGMFIGIKFTRPRSGGEVFHLVSMSGFSLGAYSYGLHKLVASCSAVMHG
jgi:hypothetical protein